MVSVREWRRCMSSRRWRRRRRNTSDCDGDLIRRLAHRCWLVAQQLHDRLQLVGCATKLDPFVAKLLLPFPQVCTISRLSLQSGLLSHNEQQVNNEQRYRIQNDSLAAYVDKHRLHLRRTDIALQNRPIDSVWQRPSFRGLWQWLVVTTTPANLCGGSKLCMRTKYQRSQDNQCLPALDTSW